MTDEEIDRMADNFVNTQKFTEVYGVARKAECGAFWKYGFLAGLKAGRPEWHDLRKDPNDLPNDDRVVSEQKGENVRYVKFRNKWFYLDRTAEAKVIAWCETPKYTEG